MTRPEEDYGDEQERSPWEQETGQQVRKSPLDPEMLARSSDGFVSVPPRGAWAWIFADGLKQLQQRYIDLDVPSRRIGSILLKLREPLSLDEAADAECDFVVADAGRSGDSEESWQATLVVLTSPPKARDDRRVQERERRPQSRESSDSAELREASLPSARLKPQEAAKELQRAMTELSSEQLFDLGTSAFVELTRRRSSTRSDSPRFREAQEAIDALGSLRQRVAALVALPLLTSGDRDRLAKVQDRLTREFQSLVPRLEGLTTTTIQEKRKIVGDLNWCKGKLKLTLVWSDGGECSVAVDTTVPDGYWRPTRGGNSLTQRTAFPGFSVKPKKAD